MTEQKSLKPVQITVFFPSSMDISEDRARWYLDHAIRGYWQHFATETDPIRQMNKCSVSVSPLTAAPASAAEPVTLRTIPPSLYADVVAPYAAALGMVREAIGELFGPVASTESEEAVLLRGPEPHHDAEALVAALQRIRLAIDT